MSATKPFAIKAFTPKYKGFQEANHTFFIRIPLTYAKFSKMKEAYINVAGLHKICLRY